MNASHPCPEASAARPVPTHRNAGLAAFLTMNTLCSLIIGLGVALAIHFSTHLPWASIVGGVGSVILAWWIILAIACAVYFASDYTRYMKIRHM